MSRFISAPSPGDIWWKTPPKEKPVNGNGASTAQSSEYHKIFCQMLGEFQQICTNDLDIFNQVILCKPARLTEACGLTRVILPCWS